MKNLLLIPFLLLFAINISAQSKLLDSINTLIIKAHGGEIKVDTKQNEGSEFIIELPLIK